LEKHVRPARGGEGQGRTPEGQRATCARAAARRRGASAQSLIGQHRTVPTFVHITSENVARKAKRGGIRPRQSKGRSLHGVFAMPVTPNFLVSHQWVREMKQWRPGPMVGVYFRVSDSELVWVGRYNEQHQRMTAAQAAAYVMSQTTMTGVQVIIPRRIVPSEILRVRSFRSLMGWRHYPDAHGKRPWACACCQRDAYGSRKIRDKYADPIR
jgi:hypothetical protein